MTELLFLAALALLLVPAALGSVGHGLSHPERTRLMVGSLTVGITLVEVGLIHPPVGMNLFVIQAQAPDVKITSIYRGIVPFLIAPLILIVLMFLFPAIALWLPKALYG